MSFTQQSPTLNDNTAGDERVRWDQQVTGSQSSLKQAQLARKKNCRCARGEIATVSRSFIDATLTRQGHVHSRDAGGKTAALLVEKVDGEK